MPTSTGPKPPRPPRPQSQESAVPTPGPELLHPEPSYAADSDWQSKLSMTGSPPRPKPTLSNCVRALRHAPEWHGVLSYNEFTHCLYLRSAPPWEAWLGRRWRPRAWGDRDDGETAIWMQDHLIDAPLQTVVKAIEIEAERQSYSSLLNFLNDLEWDGWHRIETWLTDYLGVPDSQYARMIGPRWLIAAVARAFQPGCKADHTLILEGAQDAGKSTALKTLAGEDMFSDYVSGDHNLGSKEAAILCTGVWIIEFSELEGLLDRPSRMGTVKAFLTRTHDRYRPHYAKHPISVPRQCVFAASTNDEDYFTDITGNKRFWPVRCGHIDLNGLARDREQLWAEAVKRFIEGAPWWLDDTTTAKLEQAARVNTDPWDEAIIKFTSARKDVSVNEILIDCMHKRIDELDRHTEMRTSKILKRLGWERYKDRRGARRYRRPDE